LEFCSAKASVDWVSENCWSEVCICLLSHENEGTDPSFSPEG
jgi:hypothetical protein